MKIKNKLYQLKNEKKAVLAANFYNFETLSGILLASVRLKLPVILQLSESSIQYLGLNVASSMAKSAISEYGAEAWLHLDHGSTELMVRKCLDAGFDSVMIDASEKPVAENIAVTRRVVETASGYDACVEAELGYVAKLGQKQDNEGFTQPAEALYFVENTGVHSLAVSIGSAHGFYRQEPRLDIELLAAISEKVPVPLVLHGSSGIPDTMLQEAILNGICKVNLATEIKNIYMTTLRRLLEDNDEIDLRKIFPPATRAVTELIADKLETINNIRL